MWFILMKIKLKSLNNYRINISTYRTLTRSLQNLTPKKSRFLRPRDIAIG